MLIRYMCNVPSVLVQINTDIQAGKKWTTNVHGNKGFIVLVGDTCINLYVILGCDRGLMPLKVCSNMPTSLL